MALPVESDCVHPPAPLLVNPVLQIQSEAASLPAGAVEFEVHAEHVLSAVAPLAVEYFPAPQSVHAQLPLPALYVPAAHASHAPAPSLVNPGLQIQSEAASLPAGEYEFGVHKLHVVMPGSDPYLDVGQLEQLDNLFV
jgi:hypothetical protein